MNTADETGRFVKSILEPARIMTKPNPGDINPYEGD